MHPKFIHTLGDSKVGSCLEHLMYDLTTGLGVHSYCFRAFKSLPNLIAQIKDLGLNRVELCGVHADFNDEKQFAGTITAFRDAAITITSIGIQKFCNHAVEESWFRFAKAAGCKLISMTFDFRALPDVIPATEKLAEKYDLLLGIHNHGGFHWLGNLDMMGHVLQHAGPRLGVCLDTAWAMQSGEDALQWAEKLHHKMFGIHLKDFIFDRAGRWTDVVVGTGNLKLKEILAFAISAPRMQAVTLEYEGAVANPGPALKECVAAVRHATKTLLP
jgi:inosose dehydratase